MFRCYQVCSWKSYTHCVNLGGTWLERHPLRAASRHSRCQTPRVGGTGRRVCTHMFHNMSGEAGNIPAWSNLVFFQLISAKRSRKRAWTQLFMYRVCSRFSGTAQWPVSSEIFSVNYVLSNDVTSSETKLGYQPIVLFWPQTWFS